MTISNEGFIYVMIGFSIIAFMGLVFVTLLNISDKEIEKEAQLKKKKKLSKTK